MSVDTGRVRALLDRMAEEERQLHRLAALSDEELLGDPDRLASAKYRFIVAIEAAIDVCRHIVSAAGLRAPSDFADAFCVLAEGGSDCPGTHSRTHVVAVASSRTPNACPPGLRPAC